MQAPFKFRVMHIMQKTRKYFFFHFLIFIATQTTTWQMTTNTDFIALFVSF